MLLPMVPKFMATHFLASVGFLIICAKLSLLFWEPGMLVLSSVLICVLSTQVQFCIPSDASFLKACPCWVSRSLKSTACYFLLFATELAWDTSSAFLMKVSCATSLERWLILCPSHNALCCFARILFSDLTSMHSFSFFSNAVIFFLILHAVPLRKTFYS